MSVSERGNTDSEPRSAHEHPLDLYIHDALRPQKDVERLIRKYGIQSIRNILDFIEGRSVHAKKAGRPRHSDDVLREVWLQVQIGIKLGGLSVNSFCKKAHISWTTHDAEGGVRQQTRKGASLRRLYCEAVQILRKESDALRDLKACLKNQGEDKPPEYFVSQTERWWRRELEYRLLQYQ